MMNDLQRNIMEKDTYTNKVYHTLQLGGSWNLGTLNSRVGERGLVGVREDKNQKNIFGGGCPIREVFLRERLPHWPSIQIENVRPQIFPHAMMSQLLLHSILLSYFTSKIFHFLFQQIKASTQLLI